MLAHILKFKKIVVLFLQILKEANIIFSNNLHKNKCTEVSLLIFMHIVLNKNNCNFKILLKY